MGFQFKPKMAAVLAVINGVAAGLSYIASQGDITVTILLTAISVGITQVHVKINYIDVIVKFITNYFDLRLLQFKITEFYFVLTVKVFGMVVFQIQLMPN